jgi:hypothetical protein
MYLSSMMLTNNHRDLAVGTGTSEGCRVQLCKVHPGRRYLAGNCSKASRWLLAGCLLAGWRGPGAPSLLTHASRNLLESQLPRSSILSSDLSRLAVSFRGLYRGIFAEGGGEGLGSRGIVWT